MLLTSGQIKKIDEPAGEYPETYLRWSEMCALPVIKLIEDHKPDIIVIEDTSSGSYSNRSQRILEFLHFKVLTYIFANSIKMHYFMSEEWRRIIGCKMTKEEALHNKRVRDYKRKNGTKIAYNESGKRIGILGRKHQNVARVNEYFGLNLKLKDNDEADALGLSLAWYKSVYLKEKTRYYNIWDIEKDSIKPKRKHKTKV